MPETDDQLAPTIFVLYGATGDLAARMVLPAFYTLAAEGLLPANWRLVGNGRGDVSHLDFRDHVHGVLTQYGPKPESGPWDDFSSKLLFAGGGFDTSDPGSLLDVLAHAKSEMGEDAQHVHYFAVPPQAFPELTKALGEHDLAKGSRVVYEKPFGTSQQSFRELDEIVHSVLDESQVFRIDHFLGKEATQDLHVLRFANGLFDAIWDGAHVEEVQIDVPETLDVANRADFYEHTGALLDMVVTHLFQVAAEVAMEAPKSMAADDLQEARESIIASFRPLDPSEVVLGQFEGYRDITGIPADSTTDTFAAAKLWVDTDRWRGVPFLLRTGKRMAQDAQQVSLVLRTPEGPLGSLPVPSNVISFSIRGSGEIDVTLTAKKPGPQLEVAAATASLPITSIPGGHPLPPYVSLIHDVLLGDRSLFTSSAGLEKAWEAMKPLLDKLPEPQPYAPGSWGPEAANALAGRDGWIVGQ